MSSNVLQVGNPGDAESIASLAKPSRRYRRSAQFAVTALIIFVLFYIALTAWFSWIAYKEIFLRPASGAQDGFFPFVIGVASLIVTVFMVKGVFFIKRGLTQGLVEIKASEEPDLFAFIHAIADETAAPRPHKVFLSARVNASVFYDLTLLGFVFPTRKNLEIGLGLVNVLSRGELRAVLAHEFGHFAQRSMAIGRWVYLSQQIAGHLVSHRDGLDKALAGLAVSDIRVAWIAWGLNLVVWALRALVDFAFSLVIRVQRGLSREMEFNADLVAVSLTGSDALIHALHRLGGADEAWERAVSYAMAEKANNRLIPDLFTLQERLLGHLGRVLNDSRYCPVADLVIESPQDHRIFRAEIAHPPRMWQTHPFNHERENNAKAVYVSAPIDPSSCWGLFSHPDDVRKQLTEQALAPFSPEITRAQPQDVLCQLDSLFSYRHYAPEYHGLYVNRDISRQASSWENLFEVREDLLLVPHENLYPDTIKQNLETITLLKREIAQINGLSSGNLTPEQDVLRQQGTFQKRSDLELLKQSKEYDLAQAEGCLDAVLRVNRSRHLMQARERGSGHEDYLKGLLQVIHFAEHTRANIQDAADHFWANVDVLTGGGRRQIKGTGRDELVILTRGLYRLLQDAFAVGHQIKIDGDDATALADVTLQEFGLNPPNLDNMNAWLGAVGSWVRHISSFCTALRGYALDQLLTHEAELERSYANTGSPLPPPPEPAIVPQGYPVMLSGQNRKRPEHFHWWDQFQSGAGPIARFARLAVAGMILIPTLVVGSVPEQVGLVIGPQASPASAPSSLQYGRQLTIFNGLDRAVRVSVGQAQAFIMPLSKGALMLSGQPQPQFVTSPAESSSVFIETKTDEGFLIERFPLPDVEGSPIYNIAGARPIFEGQIVYGEVGEAPKLPRLIGAPRFFGTRAAYIFQDPPASIRVPRYGSRTFDIIDTPRDQLAPSAPAVVNAITDPAARENAIRVHARWDDLDGRYAFEWLNQALALPDARGIVEARLKEMPKHVILRRLQQDFMTPEERNEACKAVMKDAAAQSGNSDDIYLSIRCLKDESAKRIAFHRAASTLDHPWLTFAAASYDLEDGKWEEAIPKLEKVIRLNPALADYSALHLARILRYYGRSTPLQLSQYSWDLGYFQRKEAEALRAGNSFDAAVARGDLKLAMAQLPEDLQNDAAKAITVASSEGAPEELVTRVLSFSPQSERGLVTLLRLAALAIRENRDGRPYLAAIKAPEDAVRQIKTFLLACGRNDFVGAEKALNGLNPDLRGHLLASGITMRPAQAPKHWRRIAQRLLFSLERPYFSAEPP